MQNVLVNFKFLYMHLDKFNNPNIALLFIMAQLTQVVIVEFINIANLMYIDDMMELVANFVALSIINDFDEFVFKVFARTEIAKLLNDDDKQNQLKFERWTKDKQAKKWISTAQDPPPKDSNKP